MPRKNKGKGKSKSKSKKNRKSKATKKKQSKKVKKSQPTRPALDVSELNTVCGMCEVWGDDQGLYGCDECRNAYHGHCLEDAKFTKKDWSTCPDLNRECNFDERLQFQFVGKPMERYVVNAAGETVQRIRTMRTTKQPKNPRRDQNLTSYRQQKPSNYNDGNYERVKYLKCEYNGIEYHIGDDILISTAMNDHNDNPILSEEIGRIREIYKEGNHKMAKLKIAWYYKKSELQIATPPGQKNTNEEKLESVDSDQYEIFHAAHFVQEITMITVLAPVNVFPSYQDFKQHLKKNKPDNENTNFFCTHAYNQFTKQIKLLPEDFISRHRIEGKVTLPVKSSRKRTLVDRCTDQLLEASTKLQLSKVPRRLPCREEEHKEIHSFMYHAICEEGVGSGLYISGLPGTGKTATVRQIARELRKKRKVKKFDYKEINAMKLPTPQHAYTELYKAIKDQHCTPATACRKLEEYFSEKDSKKKTCVLLVDELDYLLTRKQKVIYNLFDWPTRKNSKLIIIGIANTMDLPERLLPRVSSRLGVKRIVFRAYTRDQLQQIITDRLEETKVFTGDAIRYCASSVAGVSGDCRTALQICRRAIDIALKKMQLHGVCLHSNLSSKAKRKNSKSSKKKSNSNSEPNLNEGELVTIQDIKKAKQCLVQSNDIQIVSALSIYEKLFLTTMLVYNNTNCVYMGAVIQYQRRLNSYIQTSLGDSKLKDAYFYKILDKLDSIGVISKIFVRKDWVTYLKLNSSIDDVLDALNQDQTCSKILSKVNFRE